MDTTGTTSEPKTLRERFEKRYRIPENIYYSRDKNCYLFKNNHIAETYLQDEWKAYQSGAEENQCVVELPLHISVEISYGLRSNFMLASEVIAAIEASGARIKK